VRDCVWGGRRGEKDGDRVCLRCTHLLQCYSTLYAIHDVYGCACTLQHITFSFHQQSHARHSHHFVNPQGLRVKPTLNLNPKP